MLSGPAQGVSRAVDHVAGAACAHVAAAETVVRTSAAPRGDVVFGLPPAQVQADRRDAGVGGEPREAVEAGHVDATDAVELRVEINVRLVAAGFLRPTRQRGPRGGCALDRPVNGEEVGLDRGVARGDVLLGTVVALE